MQNVSTNYKVTIRITLFFILIAFSYLKPMWKDVGCFVKQPLDPVTEVAVVLPVHNPYTQSILQMQQPSKVSFIKPHVVKSCNDIKAMLKSYTIDLSKDQSYLSSIGHRIPFDKEMKLFVEKGIQGDLEALQFEKERLEKKLGEFLLPDWLSNRLPVKLREQRYNLERRKSLIIKVMNHDVTQIMHTMQKSPLEEAAKVLHEMRVDVFGQNSAYGPSLIRPAVQVIVPSKFTPDQLHAAEQAYHSRADYKQAMRKSPIVSKELQESQSEHTDLVQTTPTKVINISSDVDARIEQELRDKVFIDPVTDFDTYIKQMKDVLDDMQQRGDLTPVQHNNLLARGIKKLVRELHPATQVEKRFLALKSAARYLLETEFGHLYMNDEQLMQRVQQVEASFDGLSKFDLSKVTPEQWTDLSATVLSDLPYDIGIFRGISYLQEISALGKAEEVLKNYLLPCKMHINRHWLRILYFLPKQQRGFLFGLLLQS